MTRSYVVTLFLALLLFVTATSLYVSAALNPGFQTAACDRSSVGVSSTPMEAALDELRRRFPGPTVIGFEELTDDPRPACEPHVDLGPPETTLLDAIKRVRQVDAKYRVEVLKGRLVHVHPAHGTADPPALLDLVLHNFGVPPDDCLQSAMTDGIARGRSASYTPELGDFPWNRQEQWDHSHGHEPRGIIGSILGDCYPSSRPGSPTYHNITLRQALWVMALRSLQVARGEARSNGPSYAVIKPLSWKFRFRRGPEAESGIGGIPFFQTF